MTSFVQARVARLWSVCLPALFLTLVFDMVGQYLSITSYHPMQPYTPFKWIASIGINAMFLNQVWGLNIYPGTNGPFWSLSYEFWYYVMFGAFVYLKGYAKFSFLLFSLAIVGPKILMAFPIWLFGVVVFLVMQRKDVMQVPYAWILWLSSSLALLIFIYFDANQFLENLFPRIAQEARWSVDFWPTSYLIGMFVAMNILGFAFIGHYFADPLERISSLLRLGANISFGLYLFHYPLMYFCRAVLVSIGIADGAYFVIFIYTIPFLLSAFIAFHCERCRPLFTAFISKLTVACLGKRFGRSVEKGGAPVLHVRSSMD